MKRLIFSISSNSSQEKFEVNTVKFFVLSTGHMTENDDTQLTDIVNRMEEGEFCPYDDLDIEPNDYGFTIKIGKLDKAYKAIAELGLSRAFSDIVALADKMKCKYVKFDADAKVYKTLPLFDW